MVRSKRRRLRVFLLVVILVGFVGAWYADSTWQALTRELEVEISTETDWISVVAVVLEDGIKFFQGATADTQ
jgi:hypothetical protein